MLETMYPLCLTGAWSTCAKSVSDTLNDWLFDSSSLTQRLKDKFSRFEVTVLSEKRIQLSDDSRMVLDCDAHQAFVREVLLVCDGKPAVYAQSVIPDSSLENGLSSLTSLGTKPLGEVIFNNEEMIRLPIQAAAFSADSQLVRSLIALKVLAEPQETLWGRRSVFRIHNQPISVTEVFLPDSEVYW